MPGEREGARSPGWGLWGGAGSQRHGWSREAAASRFLAAGGRERPSLQRPLLRSPRAPFAQQNGLAREGGGASGLGPAPAPPPDAPPCATQPPRAGLLSAGGGGAGSRLQAEMLQMDLIDAAGDTPGAEDDEEDDDEERAARRSGAGPPKAESGQEPASRGQGQSQGQGQGPGSGDTYRPKRPTTLNLFPQVPRSQVRCQRGGGGRRPGPPRRCEGERRGAAAEGDTHGSSVWGQRLHRGRSGLLPGVGSEQRAEPSLGRGLSPAGRAWSLEAGLKEERTGVCRGVGN